MGRLHLSISFDLGVAGTAVCKTDFLNVTMCIAWGLGSHVAYELLCYFLPKDILILFSQYYLPK
jgi:hypothetical protein